MIRLTVNHFPPRPKVPMDAPIRRSGKYVFELIRRISADKRIVCQRGSWWYRLWQRNQRSAEDAMVYD